jgi:hypothetical protein
MSRQLQDLPNETIGANHKVHNSWKIAAAELLFSKVLLFDTINIVTFSNVVLNMRKCLPKSPEHRFRSWQGSGKVL